MEGVGGVDEEQLQQVVSFVRSALDAVEERFEERFGKPITERLDRLEMEMNYLRTELTALRAKLDREFDQVRKQIRIGEI